MKRILLILTTLYSFTVVAESDAENRIVGIWEGSSNSAGGIYFYDQLVVKEDLSGVFLTGGIEEVLDGHVGGEFTKNHMVDKGGYYEITFPNNPNSKLLVTYDLSSNSLKGWLFITDKESGFTFSPFIKELYKTNGKGRAEAITEVNKRVNKLLQPTAKASAE